MKKEPDGEYVVVMLSQNGKDFLILNNKNTYVREKQIRNPWVGNLYEAYRKASLQKIIRRNPKEHIGTCELKRGKDGSMSFLKYEEMPER